MFHAPIQLKCPLNIPRSIMPTNLHHLICSGNHSGNQSSHFPVVTLHGGALEVCLDKVFQWYHFCAWIPAEPARSKCAKSHVRENKIVWEAFYHTFRVKEVKLLAPVRWYDG
jgi:hypothetical protein